MSTLATVICLASWYMPTGNMTAYGHRYDGKAMTCAADRWPDGTVLEIRAVKYPWNGLRKKIAVKVTDRLGPTARKRGRDLDLSPTAFQQLCPLVSGTLMVEVISTKPPRA